MVLRRIGSDTGEKSHFPRRYFSPPVSVRLPNYRGPLMALLLGPGQISNDVDYRCDECGGEGASFRATGGPPLTKENGLLSAVSEISGCAASGIST
jgi:hypothetical protein